MANTLTSNISSYRVTIKKSFNELTSIIELKGTAGPKSSQEISLQFNFPESPFPNFVGFASDGDKAKKFAKAEIWFQQSDFVQFYEVLSSENPVSLRIEYTENNQPAGSPGPDYFITSASLLTGDEKPGDSEKS